MQKTVILVTSLMECKGLMYNQSTYKYQKLTSTLSQLTQQFSRKAVCTPLVYI